MNSLLRGIGSSLMGLNKPAAIPMSTQQGPNILMQAFGAALRHESPQEFLQKLAETHPELRQYDFSNIPQTAQQVCQQNGVNMQEAVSKLDNITSSLV